MNSSPGSINVLPRSSSISSAPSPPRITCDEDTPEYDATALVNSFKPTSGYLYIDFDSSLTASTARDDVPNGFSLDPSFIILSGFKPYSSAISFIDLPGM